MAQKTELSHAPLGKKTTYVDTYDNTLLFPIQRKSKREEIGISENNLPFYGFDSWTAFEISWLNLKGKPVVSLAKFDIPATTPNLIESKSFKLYLNSFNNTKFSSPEAVAEIIKKDLDAATRGDVTVQLIAIDDISSTRFENFSGTTIDNLDVTIDDYTVNTDLLSADENKIVSESLTSHLLKSNCLVTGQPDWGSLLISYTGPKIEETGLLKYIVSFRNHNEFHEQCVERVFVDIMRKCHPQKLTVHARYTRRGGLDINPIRSTEKIEPPENIRNIRQ